MTGPGETMGAAEAEIEALLFAATGPVALADVAAAMPGTDVEAAIAGISGFWAARGVHVTVKDGRASMVPAASCMRVLSEVQGVRARGLSQAAVETLSFIALNQPVTLADVERGRGLKLFKGIMDSLMDAGLVRAAIRRTDSGRAAVYVTTDEFLDHFGLSALSDLPTPEEMETLANPPSD